ncbi:MAG TPA: hypothetical protein PJ984_01425 [Candidatus Saccharibacteria bacterium]|jgi:hypothetical protein|nr:hypothetical protein [Candidatus Saccharibacteria bacterium]
MKNSTFKLRQKYEKPGHRRLFIFIGIFLAVLVLASYVGYGYLRPEEVDKNIADPTLVSEKTRDSSASNQPESKSNQKTSTVTSQQVPVSQTITLSDAAFNQANGSVTSSVLVDGVSETGKCVFTFTATDSKPVVEESTSVSEDGMQKCSTSIQEVRFDKIGIWSLDVTFFQDNQKASTNLEVEIN